MKRTSLRTLAARIALAATAVAALSVAVVVAGVLLVSSSIFDQLMIQHGATIAVSHQMFTESVTRIVVVTAAVGLVGAILLALFFGRHMERPLAELGHAARRVAAGAYHTRVGRPGSPELAALADSFNQMAASLEDQERQRRDLILNFAHELRTPLTNLHGYLAAIRDDVLPATPKLLSSLQEEIDRLMRLSGSLDVLAAGGLPEAKLEEVDVVIVMKALLELVRPRLTRRSIRIDIDLPSALSARADPDVLSQVVSNLLQNASRYTPDGGRVTIGGRAEADTVLVTVANTGPGIAGADLPHVFERFYRVEKSRDRARGGTGIGLAIVKQLVETAGGRVGVESEPGMTRFWFTLPA